MISHTITLGKAPPAWLYEICRTIIVSEIEAKMDQQSPDFQLCFVTLEQGARLVGSDTSW